MTFLIRLFIPVSLATWLSILYVDRPVSMFIQDNLYKNRHWSSLTSNLPDILLLFVVCVSIAAYLAHLHRRRQRVDGITRMLGFISLVLPVAYLAKTVLKLIFGRVQTRFWLEQPEMYEFHWLKGGDNFEGFPSGHMLVFAVLFAAIVRYHSGSGRLCYGLLSVLALALISTNYHFVSDVIFGAYAGFLVEGVLARICEGRFAGKPY